MAKIKALTKIGVHAAAVFSNAEVAYDNAPSIIRPGRTLMAIGLPCAPLDVLFMDLALAKLTISKTRSATGRRSQGAEMRDSGCWGKILDARPRGQVSHWAQQGIATREFLIDYIPSSTATFSSCAVASPRRGRRSVSTRRSSTARTTKTHKHGHSGLIQNDPLTSLLCPFLGLVAA